MPHDAAPEKGLLPPPRLDPPAPWRVGPCTWDFRAPLVMGVLNVTPDSFSDGGCYLDPVRALERARQLEAEGAHLIDVGGSSSHPRAEPVTAETELERVAPVVERLARESAVPISIDTTQPAVAEECLRLGAHLINDVSGLTCFDMAQVAARHDVPLVVTHNGWLRSWVICVPGGAQSCWLWSWRSEKVSRCMPARFGAGCAVWRLAGGVRARRCASATPENPSDYGQLRAP